MIFVLFYSNIPKNPTGDDIARVLTEAERSNALAIALHDVAEGENESDEEFEARPDDNSLLSEVMSNIKLNGDFNIVWEILGVNCSAHTLQLAIKDALKLLSETHSQVIELCRCVAKHLRKSSTIQALKKDGISYSLPRLDVETRWGSMFTMVRICLITYLSFYLLDV